MKDAKQQMYDFLKGIDEERAEQYKKLNLEKPETVKLNNITAVENLLTRIATFCRKWGR